MIGSWLAFARVLVCAYISGQRPTRESGDGSIMLSLCAGAARGLSARRTGVSRPVWRADWPGHQVVQALPAAYVWGGWSSSGLCARVSSVRMRGIQQVEGGCVAWPASASQRRRDANLGARGAALHGQRVQGGAPFLCVRARAVSTSMEGGQE